MLRAELSGRRQEEHLVLGEPVIGIMSVRAGSPRVTVPVLSNTTVSILWAVSNASPDLIRMPCSAPFPIPTINDVGVANPSAHGQAITSTVTAVITAYTNAGVGPKVNQTMKVRMAPISTAGTK